MVDVKNSTFRLENDIKTSQGGQFIARMNIVQNSCLLGWQAVLTLTRP